MNKDQKLLAEAYGQVQPASTPGLEQAIVKAMEQHDPEINYKKFAAVVSSILKDQFGQHLVNDFIAELQKSA